MTTASNNEQVKQPILYVGSEGNAWKCGKPILKSLLKIAFPTYKIKQNNDFFHLFVKSHCHFLPDEPPLNEECAKTAPYITWSGESYAVQKRQGKHPIIEINSFGPIHCVEQQLNSQTLTVNIPMIVLAYLRYTLDNGYQLPQYHHDKEDSRYFLAYCASNAIAQRDEFFQKVKIKALDNNKSISALGKCGNPPEHKPISGNWRSDDLIKAYSMHNFVLCMENKQKPGYMTEKLLSAFFAGAIPVYWGANLMAKLLFNEKRFICISDFESFDKCVDYLIELDNDVERLDVMKKQPIFNNNIIPDMFRLAEYSSKNVDEVNVPFIQQLVNHLRINLPQFSPRQQPEPTKKVIPVEKKTSFSQISQDVILNEKFFHNAYNGVFCDIGAHDGIKFSNSYFFEKYFDWSGLCVEPIPRCFELLRQNRSCICIQGCAYNRDGEVEFQMNEGKTEMLSGITETYDPRHEKRIENTMSQHGGSSQIVRFPCFRLDNIFDQFNISIIDYLSIDTEGSELQVLQGIDFNKVHINVIEVEENYPDQAKPIYDLLQNHGFQFACKIQWDTIFVHRNIQWSWHNK